MPATFVVTTVADSGAGSLRQAITSSNTTTSGTNTIDFDIGAVGSSQTISPASPLPIFGQPVVIDGRTQGAAGYAGTPLVTINGAGAGSTATGLAFGASGSGFGGSAGSTVEGLEITGFYDGIYTYTTNIIIGGTTTTPGSGAGNVISGNSNISLVNANFNNLIEGNLIGTNAAGNAALPNKYGIYDQTFSNTIGGSAAGAGNVISRNSITGLEVNSDGYYVNTDDLIEGNKIGTDLTGTQAIGNGIGIYFGHVAQNTIGGTTTTPGTGAGNLISGNSGSGIDIDGGSSNLVEGDLIGTNLSGTARLPNDLGVEIQDASTNDTIGGLTAQALNVISGNGLSTGIDGYGVQITGLGTTGNVVEGDYIGAGTTGLSAVPNFVGVQVDTSASGNTIGGSTTSARDVISGNSGDGVRFQSPNNVVEGVYIGVDQTGSTALDNQGNGVNISSPGNTIGGVTTTPGMAPGNVISGNTIYGVQITGSAATGNLVEGDDIGTDFSGTSAIPNVQDGIEIDTGATGNTIGGITTMPGTGAGNLISGNVDTSTDETDGSGVLITGTGTNGNVVEGNLIGTKVGGTSALSNYRGVVIAYGASSNTVGGVVAGDTNEISGNAADGVWIIFAGTNSNVIAGNLIGTQIGDHSPWVTAAPAWRSTRPAAATRSAGRWPGPGT